MLAFASALAREVRQRIIPRSELSLAPAAEIAYRLNHGVATDLLRAP